MRVAAAIAAALAHFVSPAFAAIDLSAASVERLDNGLTLILLEDRTFPVVSVQTTYRTGAKDDPAGRLGLAHFFEHMAFRGSKNFPETGLTDAIYAVGGEWHGYTWIDNTNYFATAPKAELPLLLDIEADRMARLELRKEDIEAERGAVLAEMNGYANDPDSTLFDALMAAHFLTHPYRNNTIGYASDVNAITHEDVVDFYERNYAPQNAVLAIVGDFDRNEIRTLVKKKFGKIKKKILPRAPLTAELPRTGERRVTISLPSDEKLFKIAYPAPAASHPDFPAFLVLQALIGKPSGVNFNQNDWGTPVGGNSLLSKIDNGFKSWIIPTAESYPFVLSGAGDTKANKANIEAAIQAALDRLSENAPEPSDLAAAKGEVLTALAFDIETTEDAAHQLAYFAGIGAFDQLLTLDENLAAVTAEDITRVAAEYLRKDKRTIAWLEPGTAARSSEPLTARETAERLGAPTLSGPIDAPKLIRRENRSPALFQRSIHSATVAISALVSGRYECARCVSDDPVFGRTIVRVALPEKDFRTGFRSMVGEISSAKAIDSIDASNEPLARIEEFFRSHFASRLGDGGVPAILTIAISGAVDFDDVIAALDATPAKSVQANSSGVFLTIPEGDFDIAIEKPLAQEAIGFFATDGHEGNELATRIALYALSHGYSGRLGKEAIARRGLAYYIDSQYRAGVGSGVVTIAASIDPEKVDAFRDLLKSEIARLKTEPPTDAEISDAKRHLLGRKINGAQSNEEIADALIRDFLAVGRPESPEEFAARLEKVTREDVLKAVEALQNGAVVTVRGKGVD